MSDFDLNKIIEEHDKKEKAKQMSLSLVNEIQNNNAAVEIAKKRFEDLKNQKKLARGISKVVDKKAATDIRSAETIVLEQQKNDRVKRAEINNALFKIKSEKKFLKRERQHNLKMQKFNQRKEKYSGLMERNKIDYLPSIFKIYILLFLESIVNTLNLTAQILGKINRNLLKGLIIIVIVLLVFVEPARNWVFTVLLGK